MIKKQEIDGFFNRMVEDSQFSAAVLVADCKGIVLKGGYRQTADDDDNPTKIDLPATKARTKFVYELFN